MSVANDFSTSITGIVADASNIRIGNGSSNYQLSDFQTNYPQFGVESDGVSYLVPQTIQQQFINLAVQCINQNRWHDNWYIAVGWFVAHFCTLYIQGTSNPNAGANAVIAAGSARGLFTSKSVGDVSTSIDYENVGRDLDGWAAWKLTIYGQQLATFGRLLSKGGMLVY